MATQEQEDVSSGFNLRISNSLVEHMIANERQTLQQRQQPKLKSSQHKSIRGPSSRKSFIQPATERDRYIIEAVRAQEQEKYDIVVANYIKKQRASAVDREKQETSNIMEHIQQVRASYLSEKRLFVPLCKDQKQQVINCYKQNKNGDVLACRHLVEAFHACASSL